MNKKVRVRFAPSPTGGLHLGGMRTVLYNYLYAKQNDGDFILRIEDTDQSRYVAGAEEYIFECLEWAGLEPDESAIHGGSYGPYRQSERKDSYRQYAIELIEKGYAYYAFDSPADLEQMRNENKTDQNPSPQYDHRIRGSMRNSLSLSPAVVQDLLDQNAPYVVRIKMPEQQIVSFVDMIHAEVNFDTSLVDDKVLLKADGMPTYHLAVVVDDYLMKITHAFRGEEWLSSAPVHVLLWKYLFGLENMPEWAHLPLILGPNGKLSKRDGAKYGFPVFAKNWKDPITGELTEGFMEKGFLPEGFINMLAFLGWNDGTEKELFTKEELIRQFSIQRVHSSGAKFDYDKAKWFNHEWIKRSTASDLRSAVKKVFTEKQINITDDGMLDKVIELVKDRCALIPDFVEQAFFFFQRPSTIDRDAIMNKWNDAKKTFFKQFNQWLQSTDKWDHESLESAFKQQAADQKIKPGELLLPLRVMLVGGKFGPPVFQIAEMLGCQETVQRIQAGLEIL